MPRENPYAAPQTVDPAADFVGAGEADVSVNGDSIRMGARLTLKATWLVLLALVVTGVGGALPEIRNFVPLMRWILLGAAAFCFLLSIVAFWQATTAGNVRRLMQTAFMFFVMWGVFSLAIDWVLPRENHAARLAWNVLVSLLSMAHMLTFIRGIARIGRVVRDRPVMRSADVAAWCWGSVSAFVVVTNSLALHARLRDQFLVFLTPEQPWLVGIGIVLGVLVFVGLTAFIRALWRLKRVKD